MSMFSFLSRAPKDPLLPVSVPRQASPPRPAAAPRDPPAAAGGGGGGGVLSYIFGGWRHEPDLVLPTCIKRPAGDKILQRLAHVQRISSVNCREALREVSPQVRLAIEAEIRLADYQRRVLVAEDDDEINSLWAEYEAHVSRMEAQLQSGYEDFCAGLEYEQAAAVLSSGGRHRSPALPPPPPPFGGSSYNAPPALYGASGAARPPSPARFGGRCYEPPPPPSLCAGSVPAAATFRGSHNAPPPPQGPGGSYAPPPLPPPFGGRHNAPSLPQAIHAPPPSAPTFSGRYNAPPPPQGPGGCYAPPPLPPSGMGMMQTSIQPLRMEFQSAAPSAAVNSSWPIFHAAPPAGSSVAVPVPLYDASRGTVAASSPVPAEWKEKLPPDRQLDMIATMVPSETVKLDPFEEEEAISARRDEGGAAIQPLSPLSTHHQHEECSVAADEEQHVAVANDLIKSAEPTADEEQPIAVVKEPINVSEPVQQTADVEQQIAVVKDPISSTELVQAFMLDLEPSFFDSEQWLVGNHDQDNSVETQQVSVEDGSSSSSSSSAAIPSIATEQQLTAFTGCGIQPSNSDTSNPRDLQEMLQQAGADSSSSSSATQQDQQESETTLALDLEMQEQKVAFHLDVVCSSSSSTPALISPVKTRRGTSRQLTNNSSSKTSSSQSHMYKTCSGAAVAHESTIVWYDNELYCPYIT